MVLFFTQFTRPNPSVSNGRVAGIAVNLVVNDVLAMQAWRIVKVITYLRMAMITHLFHNLPGTLNNDKMAVITTRLLVLFIIAMHKGLPIYFYFLINVAVA